MMDDLARIFYDATIDRMEMHEYEFSKGIGKKKNEEELKATHKWETVLEKLTPEERTLFEEYSNARASAEAARNKHLYESGFKDGVKVLKELMSW